MTTNFPDPSIINQIDFYSSSFRIMKLLRRRGWDDIVPMNGGIHGLMPQSLFKKWESYNLRKKLVRGKNGGIEFERFVAQLITQYYCNPAVFSTKVLDLSPGGDFDILVEGPSESLFYFETKTSIEKTKKSVGVPEIWNFMVREISLGADMSVFLYDSNHNLEEVMIPFFEILYSLADYLNNNLKKLPDFSIEPWIEKMENSNFTRIHRKIGDAGMYFLYWPVVILRGGDKIKQNIGEALQLYYGAIKYLSPYERLGGRPDRFVFQKLPHWRELPKEVKRETIRRRMTRWANEAYLKDKKSSEGVGA